jgi:uncharacterized protein involved in exopolysaccharide biosynthesis
METTPLPSLTPGEVLHLLRDKRKLWLGATLGCGLLAAVFSLVMPRYWEASQALVVRQETAGARTAAPGKFTDLYEMRTLQETILELAKSQQVVLATLKAVNERLNGAAGDPSAQDVEDFRNRLKMLPPNGSEFGKTEVFYFTVKDKNRTRAIELVGELCRQLDGALKTLRVDRAQGLIAELEEEVELATRMLTQETERLAKFETQVGADLGELRMLHTGSSGQSDLRQQSVELEADLRKYETQVRDAEQLLSLLKAAQQDPQKLIATPNSLLASQPALSRLKDGLVDAQLASARLVGTRSPDHPRVKAAAEAEKQIRNDLHRELVTAIHGAEVELNLGKDRVSTTQKRLRDLDSRLDRLAQERAEYSNRVAAVESCRQTLDVSRQNLSTAQAAEAAAHSGSLVTRIDQPETGPYPAGPGRTTVAGAGMMGGLMLGLGLIFMNVRGVPRHDSLKFPSHGFHDAKVSGPQALAARSQAWTEELSPRVSVNDGVDNEAPPVVIHSRIAQAAQPPAQAAGQAASDTSEPWTVGKARDNASTPAVSRQPLSEEAIDEQTVVAELTEAATSSWLTEMKPTQPSSSRTKTTSVAAKTQPAPQKDAHELVAATITEPVQPPSKKSLPARSGKLPKASGKLPTTAQPASAGMSLQEALEAARLAQR